MTKTELDNLIEESKRLDKMATEGPWFADTDSELADEFTLSENYVHDEHGHEAICITGSVFLTPQANAQFVAHARTAYPALVAEVERLSRCLDQAIDHNTGLQDEYNATQEAISDLANAMGIDAEARWDHDSCPNNSDMIRELIAELKARETHNEDL